jgi:hypothetical protein
VEQSPEGGERFDGPPEGTGKKLQRFGEAVDRRSPKAVRSSVRNDMRAMALETACGCAGGGKL